MHAAAALFERESELAELDLALERVVGGAGGCAVIEGAAGIGKTSLLRALRDRAAANGVRSFTARGSELEQTFPYGVVRQLFEVPLVRASDSEREALLAGAAAHAAPLVTARRDAEPAATGEDATFAVVHGLYWLAANFAQEEPLLLAVDDLHWADGASLRWIAYLAHRIEGLPILVAATVRRLEGDGNPSLAALLGDPATLTIRPGPLTPNAAAALISERVSIQGFEEMTAAHDATAGNPLLLRELAGALAQMPHAGDFVAEVERLAPEIVSRRVRLELAKLGSEATALAQAVAVIGDDAVCSECAPELARLEREQADHASGRLARAEILQHDRPLRFVHPLVRAAVYDALPPAERDLAHARAAELLSRRGAPAETVAAQLLRTAPGGRPEAVELLRHAARRALADGAPDSALSYLCRALDEPPPADQRPDVLLELADTEGRLGLPDAPVHLREAVNGLGDPGSRTRARLALARALFWRSRAEQSAEESRMALAETESDPELRRRLEAEYYSAALRVPALSESALAGLDEVDPVHGGAAGEGARLLLALKAYALAHRGERREEAIAFAEEALSQGIPTVDTPAWSLWAAVSALLWGDSLDTPFRVVDEAIEEARRRGAAYQFAAVSAVRSSLLQARGTLDGAEADARAGADALPPGASMIAPFTFGQLADVLVERGAYDEAARLLDAAGARSDLPADFSAFALLRARGRLRLAQGDARAAAADAQAAGRAAESVGFRNPVSGGWRSDAALAFVAAGDPAAARPLAAEEHRIAVGWGAPRGIGRSLRALGLAEGGKRGLTTLEKSAAALASSPMLLERAHSLVALGAATRRAGHRVDARAHLREGLDLAQRCGAGALVARAHEELIAAGAKPRTKAVTGVESLTPSERRVAAMAAEGMSNRDIAQALFVTLRTVEMHLSNSFRKLDIGSRTQLIDALAG